MVKPYCWLAQYYDELFSSFRSRSPIDAARKYVLGGLLPHVRAACDLACGTGTTALTFAGCGIKTYAVDLSPVMCRIARGKASRARLIVRVLRADMQKFRLPERVDLITCEYDALNHLARRADLRRVASAVARALNPGGHFFFDVNNSLAFNRYWSGTVWIEKPRMAVVIRNGHNREADWAWSDIELFVRKGRCWRRYHERIEEICWSPGEIRRVLREAGFDQLRAWDSAPFFKKNPVVTRGCRTVYLARKSEI